MLISVIFEEHFIVFSWSWIKMLTDANTRTFYTKMQKVCVSSFLFKEDWIGMVQGPHLTPVAYF